MGRVNKTSDVGSVLLVSRAGGVGRLGQSVAVEMDSKGQGPQKFHRNQEDDISVPNSRKHGKR